MVQDFQLQYCFQASPPDSRPEPVALLPPKPHPISAPEVDWLTLTIPQSEPEAEVHLKTDFMSLVNRLEESPCLTRLLSSMASSSVEKVATSVVFFR